MESVMQDVNILTGREKNTEATTVPPGGERTVMLEAMQNAIRSYGWQSAAARLLAIASVPVFLALWPATNLYARIAPVLCMFLLWLLDGHWKEMQYRYILLFHDSLNGRNPDLEIQLHETYNVGSLWKPMAALQYIALIGLFALVGLR